MTEVDRTLRLATTVKAECIGVRVARLQRLVSRCFARALRPHGLTVSQMEVLSALTLRGAPASPALMARRLFVERSTMSRNLAVMEASAWIAVTDTSASGRFMAVTITHAGKKKLLDARDAWVAAQTSVLQMLGADAPRTLDRWLGDLTGSSPRQGRLAPQRRSSTRPSNATGGGR
jgi:DNA-binding MarR family transcriptional regulator